MPGRTTVIALIVLAIALGAAAGRAEAQQGYDFGVRFDRITFRPVNFAGFGFSGPVFRGITTRTIQFEGIVFPAFNSPAVRRALKQTAAEPRRSAPRARVPEPEPGRRRDVARLQIGSTNRTAATVLRGRATRTAEVSPAPLSRPDRARSRLARLRRPFDGLPPARGERPAEHPRLDGRDRAVRAAARLRAGELAAKRRRY